VVVIDVEDCDATRSEADEPLGDDGGVVEQAIAADAASRRVVAGRAAEAVG
jgi:hypothetical protein